MSLELPTPDEILEELADKAALQIDKLAPVAFDAAFKELTRYHHFLLTANASTTPDGKPFNYASVPGEAWRAPYNDWIGQYRGLFERAANRIADAPDFFEKLAHAPLRLLPHREDPQLPDEVLQGILDLNLVLIHRLEAWVTKRTVAETALGGSASPRMQLAGSDAKSYANLMPRIVGAWESLLQAASTLYRWRDQGDGTDQQRWDALRATWPYLWQHLRNTAYMLAVAVWNEDELGTALLRDALVRWPQTLRHHFYDRAYLLERRLLFPDIVDLNLAAAQARLSSLLPEHMPAPTPEELFNATLQGAHDDVLLLTAALLLQWSMESKQLTDIGAKTAISLLCRELEDPDNDRYGTPQDKTFGSLMMDIVRLEIAGDRHPKGTYGSALDHLVETLDNMTERRVVPGRIYTPSTLHGREGLQSALLAMLLARAPQDDDALLKRVQDLAKNEAALPTGDRSLRDVLQSLDRFRQVIDAPPPTLQRGLTLIQSHADFAASTERTKSIVTDMVAAIEQERTARLRAKSIDGNAIALIRDAVDVAMTTPPGGVFFFRGFPIHRAAQDAEAELFTFRLNGLSKAQFVDPPMEWETLGFTSHFAEHITHAAGQRVWGTFNKRPRDQATVPHRIEDPAFWQQVKALAADVGAEPILLVSRQAEGRALRQFVYQLREPPGQLTIERKGRQDMGDFYIATVEGVDVYGADFEPGTAWLFSSYILRSVSYASIDKEEHVTEIAFEPGDDLIGSLVAKFKQATTWGDWPIYEIRCDDPPDNG